MCLFYSIGAGGTNASSLAIDSPTKGKYVYIVGLLTKTRILSISKLQWYSLCF